MGNRKSGIHKSIIEDFKNMESEFTELISPYANFMSDYENLKIEKLYKDNQAYVVTFTHKPELLYICFTSGRYKAKGDATKYFRELGVDTFENQEWRKTHNKARARRVPQWDRFFKEKKVPIKEIMKIGGTFRCSMCGEGNFTYEDLQSGRCFILEGEGDICEFIKGYVLCYNCFKKLGGECQ